MTELRRQISLDNAGLTASEEGPAETSASFKTAHTFLYGFVLGHGPGPFGLAVPFGHPLSVHLRFKDLKLRPILRLQKKREGDKLHTA